MNRNVIIVIVLVILVLLTAVQAIQLSGLMSSVSTGKVNVASSNQKSSASVPSNINELPSMVGGC